MKIMKSSFKGHLNPHQNAFGGDVYGAISLHDSKLLSIFYHTLTSKATVPFPISGKLV